MQNGVVNSTKICPNLTYKTEIVGIYSYKPIPDIKRNFREVKTRKKYPQFESLSGGFLQLGNKARQKKGTKYKAACIMDRLQKTSTISEKCSGFYPR
jgi:hypothetical protein